MKLLGVAMVRNEADIVEAFVRHNLTRLDGLVIVDHNSADDTPGILASLAREGLPVSVLASTALGYAQVEITTLAVRHAFARTRADFVFPLDADEFIKTPSRSAMERALAAIPAGMHGLMTWHTYLPDFAAAYGDVAAIARDARRLAEERYRHGKVVIARHFTEQPRNLVAAGNHGVGWQGARSEDLEPHHVLPADALALAHLPIRSAQQFVAKVAVARLGLIAAGRDWAPRFDRREAYDRIRAGEALDAAFVRAAAVNFNVATEHRIEADAARFIDDPFLAAFPLRYTPQAPVDALPLVLAAVERLAAAEANARRGAGAAAPPRTGEPRQ